MNSGPLPSSVPSIKPAKESQVGKAVTRQDGSPEIIDTNTKSNGASRESYDDDQPTEGDNGYRGDRLGDETQIDGDGAHCASINHSHGNSNTSRTNILPEITLKPPKKHTPTLDHKDPAPQKSDTVKPIALPGRRDTPISTTSQKTLKLNGKELLDTILEVQHHESQDFNRANEFRLKRINHVDDEEEIWSQHNSPTPSRFKTGTRISIHDGDELRLPPGYTTTRFSKSPPRRLPKKTTTLVERLAKSRTSQTRTVDLGSKSLAPISERPTSREVNRISSWDHDQPTKHTAGQVPSQEISLRSSKRGQTLDTFHARLLEKGISFSTPDVIKNHQPEDLDTTDSNMSDDESVSDSDDEMQEDPEYPEHQRHVRDAFYDITQV